MNIHSAKELGALLRSRRKDRSWTQAELARRADVSPLWISQLERGKSTAQIGLVLRTLKELGLTLSAVDGDARSFEEADGPTINLDDIVGGAK